MLFPHFETSTGKKGTSSSSTAATKTASVAMATSTVARGEKKDGEIMNYASRHMCCISQEIYHPNINIVNFIIRQFSLGGAHCYVAAHCVSLYAVFFFARPLFDLIV